MKKKKKKKHATREHVCILGVIRKSITCHKNKEQSMFYVNSFNPMFASQLLDCCF